MRLHRKPQALSRDTAGDADDADEKEDQHRNDQNCFEEEILVHERLQPLGLGMVLRGRQGDDGGAGNFNLNVVRGNPQDDRIILNGHDLSAD